VWRPTNRPVKAWSGLLQKLKEAATWRPALAFWAPLGTESTFKKEIAPFITYAIADRSLTLVKRSDLSGTRFSQTRCLCFCIVEGRKWLTNWELDKFTTLPWAV